MRADNSWDAVTEIRAAMKVINPVRRAFNGLCQLLVKVTDKEGFIKITAQQAGLKQDICEIKVKEI